MKSETLMSKSKTLFLVIGIDPSTTSAGWCVLGFTEDVAEWSLIGCGQCRGVDVPGEVMAVIPLTRRKVKILAVEGMFPGPARGKVVMPPTFWKMGWSAGFVAGSLKEEDGFYGSELWVPQPTEWRDAIGIKRLI